ncbi:unnamed protein product [Arabidopsis halleri]
MRKPTPKLLLLHVFSHPFSLLELHCVSLLAARSPNSMSLFYSGDIK